MDRVGPDEPVFQNAEGKKNVGPKGFEDLPNRIRRLTQSQPFAVLCTQGQGHPYGSVVAFAFSEDLRQAVFATLTSTRKYRLLSECDHVALVIDDRPDNREDMMEVQAVTITGRAVKIESGKEYEDLASLLIGRHDYLRSFVASPTCALFRVDVVRCFHVTRFQEVCEWNPPDVS